MKSLIRSPVVSRSKVIPDAKGIVTASLDRRKHLLTEVGGKELYDSDPALADIKISSFYTIYYKYLKLHNIELLGQPKGPRKNSAKIEKALAAFKEEGGCVPISEKFLDKYGLKPATAYKARKLLYGDTDEKQQPKKDKETSC